MGAQPNLPFWRRLMKTFHERCQSWEDHHPGRRYAPTRPAPVMTGPHLMAAAWRQYRRERLASSPDLVLLPTPTFYPVDAAVERARPFAAPRTYPNSTLVAHQWGSSYTARRRGQRKLHALGSRPLPTFLHRPKFKEKW